MQYDKVEKFRDALNTTAEKWCRVSEAFETEQASEILNKLTKDWKTDEETVIAQLCAVAYGIENITVRDAALALDYQQRYGLHRAVENLVDGAVIEPSLKEVTDILIAHWRELNEKEKQTVSYFVTRKLDDGKVK